MPRDPEEHPDNPVCQEAKETTAAPVHEENQAGEENQVHLEVPALLDNEETRETLEYPVPLELPEREEMMEVPEPRVTLDSLDETDNQELEVNQDLQEDQEWQEPRETVVKMVWML